MAQELKMRPVKRKSALHRVLLYTLLAFPPAVLIVLYYILRDKKQVIDWVLTHISLPYRAVAARVSSLGPLRYFSLAEIMVVLLILGALYFIVKTIVILVRRPHRLFNLGHRLYVLTLVALYILSLYSWIWDAGYYGTDLAEKIGLVSDGITVSQLISVTQLFAEKANALSAQVERDADNHFIENKQDYFTRSKDVYANIVTEFPALIGGSYAPKPMLFSKLMSLCGFTGVYVALTGETNINIDAPSCLIPATIVHEMTHQRGVNSEEEANFFAIAACVSSEIPVYEYSGYLLGLIYLTDTLNTVDPYAYRMITATFNAAVIQDWNDNIQYWVSHETAATETAMSVYDDYLKANGIASGVDSYGACVDLLVTWSDKFSCKD